METLPLSAEVSGKVIAFERIVAEVLADNHIDHDEGLRLIAATRATNRDTLLIAEGMDFIGTIARGTAALDSPRAQRKLNERRRRGAMVTLESHHPDCAAQAA